ncbi:glutaminyl-peptide cyclotransferase [Aquimarina gracilis]|uniref:Glutaminyl-peptide cyclotransferase n=1 Tax=Aquimarina gracilis TaxID=874422 RepID=A0ABU6A2L4_9FLAO|nr:glutaminyl-peptide cyclotransferase [Aquimarina gracilis]MEB3348373.1 glutaminyl-peptide cyclotransferase [Aquimarina gracilis]
MNIRNSFVIIILSTLLFSCGSNQSKKKKYFSIVTENNQTIFKLGETIKASIKNNQNLKIDSVAYILNNKRIRANDKFVYNEKIDNEKLGTHILTAQVFYDGNIDTITKKIVFLNNVAPKLYKYKIVAEYPHDRNAFTQGLEFYGDTLYESTGHKGKSTLRKINYKTGEILIKKDIPKQFFAEGITILDNKIFQLTWQSKEGFIYDLSTLEKIGGFAYNNSKEGWGLCNDGKHIYKSDGTKKIWTLDATTLAEKDYIEVTTNKGVKSKFNELEWVEGKIYANTWQKDGIAIINPKNGALEAVIDLSGLRNKVSRHDDLDVLNGIAYKADTKQLFVTGKNWNKLFEIEIVK